MKRYFLLTSLFIFSLQGAASSSSAAAAPAAQPSRTSWATLPDSIHIPGDRGKAMEKVNLNSQDHITKMTFKDHIKDMHQYNLPWVMAAFWWVQDNGTLARDYADATSLNKWRLNPENYQIIRELHPLHQRKILYPEYYLFEVENKKLSVEFLGSEHQLRQPDGRLIRTLLRAVGDPTQHGVAYFAHTTDRGTWSYSLFNDIAQIYSHKGDAANAKKWWLKGAKREGDIFSMRALAHFYIQNKDYENARRISQKLIDTKEASKNDKHGAQNLIGYIYEIKKDIPKALKLYTNIAEARSYGPRVYARLNLLYLLATQPEQTKNAISIEKLREYASSTLGLSESDFSLQDYQQLYPERYTIAMQAARELLSESSSTSSGADASSSSSSSTK